MKIKSLLLALVLILGSFCIIAKQQVLLSKRVSAVYDLPNFHILSSGVMRGAQPTGRGFKTLRKDYNVRTVFSLRNDVKHNKEERKIVERLGMRFINIPMSGSEEQSAEKINQCLAIMNNKANQPIFVHCMAGKDRTGLISAAYRIKYNNWNFDDAFSEMCAYGYDKVCCFPLEESLIKWYKEEKG